MASCLRDEDIDNQLISDISDIESSEDERDGSQSDDFKQKMQYDGRKVTPQNAYISDKSRTSRKRKASTELFHEEPPKKMYSLQPQTSPQISPVRKSRTSRYVAFAPNLEKISESPQERESSVNQCSPRKAIRVGTAGKSPDKKYLFPPQKKRLKAYPSPSEKRNEKLVTNSPVKNKINGNKTSQNNNIHTLVQASDSENEDRNNTPKRNKSKNYSFMDEERTNSDNSSNHSSASKRRTSESNSPLTLSPVKGQTISSKEVSVSLHKLQNSLQQKIYPDSPLNNLQELSDFKGRHLKHEMTPTKVKLQEENSRSPATPSRKSIRRTSESNSPLTFSPGKGKTILSKEVSVSLHKLKNGLQQKIYPDSPLNNLQELSGFKGRHLKHELSPTKVNHQEENIESPATPSRKSIRRTSESNSPLAFSPGKGKTILSKEVSVSLHKLQNGLQQKIYPDSPLKNLQEWSGFKDRLLKHEITPNKERHQKENTESSATPSRKSIRQGTKEAAEYQQIIDDDGDISDLNERVPGKKKHSARDEDECQEDDRRSNSISTPDRKTLNKNLNDCEQQHSTPKLNFGSPGNVNSTKVSTSLQKREITVTTPISNKRTGRSLLTPGMAKRAAGGSGSGTGGRTEDALDATRRQLHVSTVPRTLPCREEEFDHIKSFLIKKIEHCAGGCMYISGVPGTGKTATVQAVIRYLQEEVEKEVPDFDFVEINGLRLTEPKQAYVRILQSLTDQKQTAEQAQQTLNKRFSRKGNKVTVILVDELDYLCNRRQDVIYNMLEWPSTGSGVVVVAISNTMDLPERALKGRVTSRMGLTRLAFRPYTHKQLQLIVSQRLSDHPDAFHPDAVQFVARKVAAVSGDARRALDICRRTTELVHVGEQVTASHVERALAQIFSGPRVKVIRRLPRLAQLVLRALRDTAERTGVEETTVAHMYKHLVNICQLEGCDVPSPGAVLAACVSLAGLGLVVGEKRRPDVTRKLCLNVSSDDIHYALDNSDGDR